jgi:transposase
LLGKENTMTMYCGIDWSERHHDVAVVDHTGTLVAKRRINDGPDGWRELLRLLTDIGDTADEPIPVAIETTRGLLVSCLRATGRPVYAINPLAVAHYRQRHSVSRAKSDHADAMTLANILRTDASAHRPMPADTPLAQVIAVLARAQQKAVWNRTQLSNQLRSVLREYFPAANEAFNLKNVGLTSAEARAVLAAAPTPAQAAALTPADLVVLLRQAGRQRNITAWANRLHETFGREQLRQLPDVEQALGHHAAALLCQLDAACRGADDLAGAVTDALGRHPDAKVILSFPGLGPVTGSRILAEIGDDRTRFADARALRAYAGAAPITRASGKSRLIQHRRIKNQRLAATGYYWAFAALASPGARAHYDRRIATGDHHTAALRNLFNRMLGQLHHCLHAGQPYQETRDFPPQPART